MIAAMKRSDPQFKLRLPTELKARLEKAAEASGLTLSSEIITRLQQSFETAPKAEPDKERRLHEGLMHRNVLLADLRASRAEIELLQARMHLMTDDKERDAAREQLAELHKELESTKFLLGSINELVHKYESDVAKTTT